MRRYAGWYLIGLLLLFGCGSFSKFADGKIWPKTEITYRIVESGTASDIDLRPVQVRQLGREEVAAYREAIQKWNALGIVRFVEDNTERWPPQDVLIYGVPVTRAVKRGEAIAHYDPQTGFLDRIRCEILPPDKEPRINRYAALHEIGHSAGLSHSLDVRAIMFPLRLHAPLVDVTSQDRAALSRIYPGAGPAPALLP